MCTSDWGSDVCSSDLVETLDASREQSREARSKVEDAVSRMGELEGTRQALESERRSLAEARDQARTTARESSGTAHALALTLESQRTQVAALSQSLERMGSQRGSSTAAWANWRPSSRPATKTRPWRWNSSARRCSNSASSPNARWAPRAPRSRASTTSCASSNRSATSATNSRWPSARRFRSASLRSEEHTSELQSLMRISYAVFCLK